MTDSLMIATTANDMVRIYTVSTTGVVEEARRIHQTWPTATAALGRVLTGTLMMGVMSDTLKRLTVQFAGEGPLGKIIGVSNQPGTVKGYLENPQVDLDLNPLGKFDIAKAVGPGTLTVIKDHGLKNPYNGVVPIQSGEIGEDLAYYFTKSEQIPSAVGLGVLVAPDGQVQAAGGFIVQLLPGCPDAVAMSLEETLRYIPAVTTILNSGETSAQLARRFAIGSLKILAEMPVKYYCDCSGERFRGPLLSLGRQELEKIIQEQGNIEVQCQFCNQKYTYSAAEL
ncbi:molecular chaperone Hsp33 [Hydrogenispora ethanolica]|jgi:molecular chaperone Hsp33|uniref:33 kDa chaperonin n=1 Tax=Hydrogenispora ethanolica TaxID=1082276 RepID=A0A4R1RSK4_HYDET|nr:Hsp33 family molecular chaperone HslO [Hydrogenispora ethanolica]TCL69356.1 molecular chaperone Hsp33 [Hydrogenispora ethanolica]